MAPYKDIMKADGLLTILRRAIVKKDRYVAVNIARKCAELTKAIHLKRWQRFITQILLEDKEPVHLSVFQELNRVLDNFKKSLNGRLNGVNNVVTNRQVLYASIANTIASLDTDTTRFEKAFVALYDYVHVKKYCFDETESCHDATTPMNAPELQPRITKDKDLVIGRAGYEKIKFAVKRNYAGDTINLSTSDTIPEDDVDKLFITQDHVMRSEYFASTGDFKKVQFQLKEPYVTSSDLMTTIGTFESTEYFKEFKSLFTNKRKRGESEKLFNFLYPEAKDSLFKQYMIEFLKNEGCKQYVGSNGLNMSQCGTVLQHLRMHARAKFVRLTEIQIENKSYSLDYLNFDARRGWKVQLKAPKNVDAKEIAKDYPHLMEIYRIGFPKSNPDEGQYTQTVNIGENAKIAPMYYVEKKGNTFVVEKYYKRGVFSHLMLSSEDRCLAFLQILVYRFSKNYKTTLVDIVLEEKDETFTMYSINNRKGRFVQEMPNRKHPDIWHQLLHYEDPRENGKKKNDKKNSYSLKVIDKLQKYLSERGHMWRTETSSGDYPFLIWLKNNYPEYMKKVVKGRRAGKVELGLWLRLMDSMDEVDRGIPFRKNNLSRFFNSGENEKSECPYIKEEFDLRDV